MLSSRSKPCFAFLINVDSSAAKNGQFGVWRRVKHDITEVNTLPLNPDGLSPVASGSRDKLIRETRNSDKLSRSQGNYRLPLADVIWHVRSLPQYQAGSQYETTDQNYSNAAHR